MDDKPPKAQSIGTLSPAQWRHIDKQAGAFALSQFRKIGRNAMCPCGKQRKYKNCCMRKPKFSFTIPTD